MVEDKLILEKTLKRGGVNKPKNVSVEFQQKARQLPHQDVSSDFDQYELYTRERNECNKFRFIFTVNPVCSNVLFNMCSEIVEKEGSSECRALVDSKDKIEKASLSPNIINSSTIDRLQAIRDTEYSHPDCGHLVYHCGLDIFNNHLLRSDDFIHINSFNESDPNNHDLTNFNTIEDRKRNKDGNAIMELLLDSGDIDINSNKVNPHIYQLDNIKTFQEAVSDGLSVKNGWYGFVNKATIDIPVTKGKDLSFSFNKVMNNNKACEIYNLYPDISLFSFIPKVNKYRGRLERNWDYCLTYPAVSDYDKFNEINSHANIESQINGIKVIKSVRGKRGNEELVVITTWFENNLQLYDQVRIYYTDGTEIKSKICKVIGLGDLNGKNKKTAFFIHGNDVIDMKYPDKYIKWIRKENGTPCQYYLRKFKKLGDYSSEITRMAYGENIYGDRIAQIIYNDPIDVTGLVDNLGRPLSEIYLTFVKANRGHEKWYSEGEDRYTDENIEFSHCFGKVTSGLDITDNDGDSDFNIRKTHNVDTNSLKNNDIYSKLTNGTKIKKLEDNITISGEDGLFYGDIVEFDPILFKETVLTKVYHRVNTVQREKTQNRNHICFDEIMTDDYDISNKFACEKIEVDGTIQPEGYFYSPHNKVQIHELSDKVSNELGKVIDDAFDIRNIVDEDKYSFEFKTNKEYMFIKEDIVGVYDWKYNKLYWGVVSDIKEEKDGKKIVLNTQEEIAADAESLKERLDIILTSGNVPKYAVYAPLRQSFFWREILLPSQLNSSSTLYNTPFTNGCLYLHKNINFFLRRQDPFGDYGLNINKLAENLVIPDDEKGADKKINLENYGLRTLKAIWKQLWGLRFDYSKYNYIQEIDNACL